MLGLTMQAENRKQHNQEILSMMQQSEIQKANNL
jgi:hypothetical protein